MCKLPAVCIALLSSAAVAPSASAGEPDLHLESLSLRNPSAQEVQQLLQRIGRDAATAELADQIRRRQFQVSWGYHQRNHFADVVRLTTNQAFGRDADELHQEAFGRRATSEELIRFALHYSPGPDRAFWRFVFRRSANCSTIRISGRVANLDNEPIEDAIVYTPFAETKTSADGRYTLSSPTDRGLAPGTWYLDPRFFDVGFSREGVQVCVEAPGFLPRRDWIQVRSADASQKHNFQLVRATTGRVQVLESNDKPAANTEITYLLGQLGGARGYWNARTDADGFATLCVNGESTRPAPLLKNVHQVPDRISLWVEHRAFSEPRQMLTFENSTFSPNRFQLKPSFEVAGRVVDELGRPVAGASVDALTTESPRYWRARQFTDGAGRFRFQVQDVEPMQFSINAVSHPAVSPIVAPEGWKPQAKLTIELPTGRWVDGKVLRPDGSPAADVAVGWPILPDHKRPSVSLADLGQIQRVTATAADGSFRLGPLPVHQAFKITALADAPRQQAEVLISAEQPAVEIRLK
jgi:protocatechuate 3,4-dioxygenase beta subunit